jgi:hypothetical protein
MLLHVYAGFREDILRAYPELKGVDLDFKRLALNAETRGLGFFTLDLPELESCFLAGLESGRLVSKGPLSRLVSKKVRVPRLFSGLWLRVFGVDSCLLPVPDINAIFFLRQLLTFGKKLAVECTYDRRKETIRAYHDVEKALRRPTLLWSSDTLDIDRIASLHCSDCAPPQRLHDSVLDLFESEEGRCRSGDRYLLERLQRIADWVSEALGFYEPVSFSRDQELLGLGIGFKHGPGAVAERLKNWEKSRFPSWPHKLETWFPYDECGKPTSRCNNQPRNHEVAARLLCVPKTAKRPRLIASEPVAHQWCQQLTWNWLRSRLSQIFGSAFINFRRQDLSGKLVLQASLDRKLATVDLSDASDRLTCWTVERIFRRNPSLVSCLHAARTRYIRDDNLGYPDFLSLRKFASQGTATTFPVQSIVFLCIALASCHGDEDVTFESIMKLRKQVRIYGDDIIIPRYGYVQLCRLLDLLQLKVNKEKSYVNGHFRESCGTDGYLGYDVTPVKPKCIVADSPANIVAVLATSNNLFKKGFWNAADRLLSQLPGRISRRLRVVGVDDAGFPGAFSFCGTKEDHLQLRWNDSLHRYEVKTFSIKRRVDTSTREGYHVLLDLWSRGHNPWNPRIIGEYTYTRQIKYDLTWEPKIKADLPIGRPAVSSRPSRLNG